MFRIRVEKLINKNIDAVFDILSDHENYKNFSGVDKSILVEQGDSEKNGTGALRDVFSGPLNFTERITDFERPSHLGYKIEKSKPFSMRHDKGDIQLVAEGDATRVVWISEGQITTPLLGTLFLNKVFEKKAGRAFKVMLEAIEKR